MGLRTPRLGAGLSDHRSRPRRGPIRVFPLARQADGFFEAHIDGLAAGDRYWFRLDGDRLRPDPVSR